MPWQIQMDPIVDNAEGEEWSHVRPVMVLDNVPEIIFTKLFLVVDIMFCARMVCVPDAKGPDMTMLWFFNISAACAVVPDTVLFVGVLENAVLVMVPVELPAMFAAVKDDFEV